ncbi:MAG TPA: DUF4129 domain-containing protein [Ktedonobacteraceae bacterium]|jgi:MFS family permease|nr:DUF4129 domain-containing protein [Ktedonobacteraceae bacterium]
MRLFTPLLTKGERLTERRPARFNWLDTMAVPMVVGVMEAQFGVLGFVIGALLFTGKSEPPLLLEGGVILIWWSTYWWAFVVKRGIQPRLGEERAQLVYVPALPVIYLLVVGLHPPFAAGIPQLIATGILSLSFWWRGKVRVEKGGQEESLLVIFQIGFGTLLALLLLVVVYPAFSHTPLFDALGMVLPVFGLSGFAALSVSYLNTKYSSPNASRGLRTQFARTGLLTLFFLAAIAAFTMILSVAAFGPLEALFAPLLTIVRAWYFWLLGFLFAQPGPPPRPLKLKLTPTPGIDAQPEKHAPPVSPLVDEALRLLAIIGIALLTLVVLVAVVWMILHILRGRIDENEIQKSIPASARRRPPKEVRKAREPLNAASARARYREFLQAMAWRGEDAGRRRANETPLEYQYRLLAALEPTRQTYAGKSPDDAMILEELTQAYLLERYGEKDVDPRKLTYLRRWVPLLIKRLIPRLRNKQLRK